MTAVDAVLTADGTNGYTSGGHRRLLIDGEFVDARSGRQFETRNPATGELLSTLAEADADDIDRAVRSARRAFETVWSRRKPYERQRIMLRFADLLERRYAEVAMIDTLDMGAPIAMMRSRELSTVARVRYFAGLTTAIHGDVIDNSAPGSHFSYTVREPVGVVGAITPWNGPHTSAIWKIAPALAAGCCLVLKPAEQASLSALWLGELFLEAGLPPGVLNVVTGLGPLAGAALVEHGDVDKIAFTGSSATGQAIVRASAGNLKRLSLELGGKSPHIVFADADLDRAVPEAAMAAFGNSGQVCSAGTRLFVESAVYDEFVERVASFGRGLRVGNGLDPATQIGPLVSQQQFDKVVRYLEMGVEQGATTVSGGGPLTHGDYEKGYFVPPTVFADVRDDMVIAREEIFGPVLSAIRFDDIDNVIVRANDTPFGLGSGVWTSDIGKAHRMARALRAGSVWINCYNANDPSVPFGGYKMSGYGREGGAVQLDDYLETKAVWIRTEPNPLV